MNYLENTENKTLTITKEIEASIEDVWKAWTEADEIAKWWVPSGMSFKIVKHEFEAEGEWEYVMTMPDCKEFVSKGKYLEIIQHEIIVTTASFIPMTMDTIMVVKFSGNSERTTIIFNVVHSSEEYCQQQEKMGFYNGWGSTFQRLENYFENA